ncbi:MAG: amino acid permease [Candidatus Chromulinivorax sp.]|nr:amino acid permease [Candidatus Chromulinivorax sp.]
MSSSKKLSLGSAILINLNVMIGTGLFINTYDLATKTGVAGCLLYPMIGLCMLPLIAVTAKLARLFPTGGLYAFGNSYSPFLGFLSCWSYFFGKLASCTVMLSVGATALQKLIPGAQELSITTISLMILASYTILNLQNMKLGIIIQSFFLTSKSIPILFVIVAGILLLDTSIITPDLYIWSGMASSIPLVLYGLAGFETACALGRNIENPAVNGPKAVYYSFATVILLYGFFQFFIYMNSYDALATITSYNGIFSAIAHKLFSSPILANKVAILLSFAIGSSALGGAYGILFSNSWNLYTLAENNYIFGSKTITSFNKHQTPWVAVIAESLVCTMFLLCNQSSLLSLRSTAALGIVIAYTISAFAYFKLLQKNCATTKEFIISGAAFMSCMFFITSCAYNFIQTGITPLLLFIAILCIGTTMFMYKNK